MRAQPKLLIFRDPAISSIHIRSDRQLILSLDLIAFYWNWKNNKNKFYFTFFVSEVTLINQHYYDVNLLFQKIHRITQLQTKTITSLSYDFLQISTYRYIDFTFPKFFSLRIRLKIVIIHLPLYHVYAYIRAYARKKPHVIPYSTKQIGVL